MMCRGVLAKERGAPSFARRFDVDQRDKKAEQEALRAQVEPPYAPHEGADGWLDLRERCKCGCNVGRVELKNGKYVVNCADCASHAFGAPKSALGILKDPPKTVRIAARFNGRCKTCSGEHEIGHWVFYAPGEKGVVCMKCNAETK